MQNTERALFCVPRPATRIHVPAILLFQMRAAFLPVSIFKKLQAKATLPETGKLSVTLETQTPPIWETCVALRQPPGLSSRGQFANYCRGSRRVDPVTVTTTPKLPLTQSRGGRGYRAQDRIASSVVVVVIMPDSSLRGVPSHHPPDEGGPGVRGSPHRPETTPCRPQAACKPLPRLVFRNNGRRLR
jgi:hypothetical protein